MQHINMPIFIFHEENLLMYGEQLPKLEALQNAKITYKTFNFKASQPFHAGVLTHPEIAPPFKVVPLRTALLLLTSTEQQLTFQAKSLLRWETLNQYCGQCGKETMQPNNEWAKYCNACKEHYYPRLSPSVIVLVHDNDKVLLGRQSRFAPGVYSCLAGFIDPGESAEMAVHREIKEEVNLSVTSLRYFGSQPWPFPDSFMLGFFAAYQSGTLEIDHAELEDARWFSISNLPPLPSKASIAYRLIEQYVENNRQF